MNIIAELTNQIEKARSTNKNPCKSYATEAAAEKATIRVASLTANMFSTLKNPAPARYVVFYNEAWGRWVGAIDLTGVTERKGSCGGYIGVASDQGFYSFLLSKTERKAS